jgi:hypothetical protein
LDQPFRTFLLELVWGFQKARFELPQCLFYAIYCAIASGGYLLLQPRLRLQVRANAAFA